MRNLKIRTAVITVSDSRTPENDISGDRLVELLSDAGIEVASRQIVSDEASQIRELLARSADSNEVDLILTTGGTGFASRDNTPEATLAVIDRDAPGLAEAMRRETAAVTPTAILSRAVAGIRGSTLIVNLPGSPNGVTECFAVLSPVLAHAIKILRGNTAH